MASAKDIGARASRVVSLLVAASQLTRGGRIASGLSEVDARGVLYDVQLLVDDALEDAVLVSSSLANARVVAFRVVE
jgi:hypothetical protein